MSEPEHNLNELKRLLGCGDPLPPELSDFLEEDVEAQRVSAGFARLDALLASEPDPAPVDVTPAVMARLTRQARAGWASWAALAAAVALVVGLGSALLGPTPLSSFEAFARDPLALETGYVRPELPLEPLDAPGDWLGDAWTELRAAAEGQPLPSAPLALILLLAPAVAGLNWALARPHPARTAS